MSFSSILGGAGILLVLVVLILIAGYAYFAIKSFGSPKTAAPTSSAPPKPALSRSARILSKVRSGIASFFAKTLVIAVIATATILFLALCYTYFSWAYEAPLYENLAWMTAIITLLVAYYAVRLLFFELGKRNKIFTVLREGTFKAVVVGGKPIKGFLRLEGHTLGKPTKNNVPDLVKSMLEEFPDTKIILKDGFDNFCVVKAPADTDPLWLRKVKRIIRFVIPYDTIRFIGFMPGTEIWEYDFSWWAYKPNKEGDDEVLMERTKENGDPLDYIFVIAYPYAVPLKEVKLKGNLPYKIILNVDYIVVNPMRALFRYLHWLDKAHSDLNPAFNPLFGQYNEDEIATNSRVDETTKKKVGLSKELEDAGRKFNPKGWLYGVLCAGVRMETFSPTGEAATEASTRVRVAEITLREKNLLAQGDTAIIRQVKTDVGDMSEKARDVLGLLQLGKIPNLNMTLVGKDLGSATNLLLASGADHRPSTPATASPTTPTTTS